MLWRIKIVQHWKPVTQQINFGLRTGHSGSQAPLWHLRRVALRYLWNGVFGFRGRVNLKATGFFIPYYFDIGTGGSNLTWQIASGIGYQIGGAGLSVTYRYLSFQQGSDAKVKSMTLGGPVLIANFSF